MERHEDHRRMKISYTLVDDDGMEEDVSFPAKWEVCGRCDGRGVHDHPAFANGITASEWAEATYEDPDWPEDYARGVYSVTCEECGGRTTTLEVDRKYADPMALERLDDALRFEAQCRAEEAYCRRMGF